VTIPHRPYTKALLTIVPERDPRQRALPEILRGETPNPVDLPRAGARPRQRAACIRA
jgi:ABC-type dipeptide/oligopeptide/nickel transport system ATPase component